MGISTTFLWATTLPFIPTGEKVPSVERISALIRASTSPGTKSRNV